jgi:hypothetical protein
MKENTKANMRENTEGGDSVVTLSPEKQKPGIEARQVV